jgi:hypothetical protein
MSCPLTNDSKREMEETPIYKAAVKMLKLLSGKRILFLESDFTLNHSVGNFHKWCIENKMDHNSLYNISGLPIEYIMEQIDWFDVIAFETTWTYNISHLLKERVSNLRTKKIIIECYIYEPTWIRKPKVIHDVYILKASDDDLAEWEFDKLKIRVNYQTL